MRKNNIAEKPSRSKFILSAFILLLLCIAGVLLILLMRESPYDKISEVTIRTAAAARLAAVTQHNKAPNDLTDDDFAKITELDLDGTGLSDIRLLEKFTNLQELNLRHNIISPPVRPKWKAILMRLFHIDSPKRILLDLGPLKNLSNLRKLALNSSEVKNIRPLSNLTNLQELDLSYSGISDIEPIKGLIHLNMLCLLFTQVTDLEPIKGLDNLKILYLSGTPVSNIEPLRNLENLEWIFLDDTNIKDLESLKELTNLKGLNLGRTRISSLEPVKGLTNLKRIILTESPITDLEPIKGLKNLESFYIRNCINITDEQVADLQRALPELDISR